VNSWHLQPSPLSSKRHKVRIGTRGQYARTVSNLDMRHLNVSNLWAILTGRVTDPVTLGLPSEAEVARLADEEEEMGRLGKMLRRSQ